MCLCPITIPNKNKPQTALERSMASSVSDIKDTESLFIRVPCNHCSECLHRRQLEVTQRCQVELLDHYSFFGTLTYNNESLPHFATSDGQDITYADTRDFTLMVKRIRKNNLAPRPFHYILVSERGTKKGRPHFHFILFVPRYKDDSRYVPAQLEHTLYWLFRNEWRRNYGSTRSPVWKPLFTYAEFWKNGKRICNYDLHYITLHASDNGQDDVSFYVSKYIFKPSKFERRLYCILRDSLDSVEFFRTWQVIKSRSQFSKGVGCHSDLQKQKIAHCISVSQNDSDGLKFFASNGKAQPLARYYRKYVSLASARSSVTASGGPISYFDRPLDKSLNTEYNFKKTLLAIEQKDIADFYPE